METLHGLVAGIEPFAIHDGPGIRTVVFMKGCPLKCLWCSSPHTQNREAEVFYDTAKCRNCGTCLDVCPNIAIRREGEALICIDRTLCNGCGDCARNCPYKALEASGVIYTVEELFREVEKDTPFYRRSNGGVTVGGGEPTLQADFVSAFLKRCREQHIHTAMESCGMAPWGKLASIIDHLDLLFMDVKHMDERSHKKLTGVSNRVILANIRQAVERVPTVLRIPLIPGLNEDADNVTATARFAKTLGPNLIRVELLPFHHLGEDLYRKLDRKYALSEVSAPTEEKLNTLKKHVEAFGLEVQIGG